MSRILADFVAFGKQSMRSPFGLFFTFIFPVLLIVVFGSIFSNQGSTTITLSIQDLDDTPTSRAFIDILNKTNVTVVKYIPNDEDILQYIKNNSLSVALQIPKGFEANVTAAIINISMNQSYDPVNVTLYGDPSQTTYTIAQSAVGGSLGAMDYGIQNAKPILAMKSEKVTRQEFKYMDFFLPGILGFTAMTTPLFAMSSICSEYRSRGYFKLLATTSLRKSEWLVSKIAWYILIILASFALMVAVGMALFGISFTITPLAVALIAIGVLMFTSLGMFIGAFTKNPETSVAISQAIGFPMMFLSGTFFPLEVMPSYIKAVASVLPLTYLNEGLRATMIYGNTSAALIDLAVVTAVAIVFFAMAAKAMSWKGK